jgi:hypothetical protein
MGKILSLAFIAPKSILRAINWLLFGPKTRKWRVKLKSRQIFVSLAR